MENLKQFSVAWSFSGGGAGIKYTTHEQQQQYTNFFCASMAITWVLSFLQAIVDTF